MNMFWKENINLSLLEVVLEVGLTCKISTRRQEVLKADSMIEENCDESVLKDIDSAESDETVDSEGDFDR